MQSRQTLLFLIIWSAAAGMAAWQGFKFQSAAGVSSRIEGMVPKNTALELASNQFNFVTFVHPQCSCSAATMENLRTLNRDFSDKNVSFHVVFYLPKKQQDDWKNSPFIAEAQQLKNTKLYYDDTATEFKRFDARTSGQSFLFSKAGQLLFKGGITESRGHLGPTKSMRKIASYIQGAKVSGLSEAPTFGCENGLSDSTEIK